MPNLRFKQNRKHFFSSIRNLEPNCQSPYSYYSSIPRLSPNLCNPLKIFAGLSKHLPVFLLGTENVMGGVDGNTGSGLW